VLLHMSRCNLACDRLAGRRCCSVAVLVACIFLAIALPPVAAADLNDVEDEGKKPGWVLPQHSFEKTLSYDDNLGNWLASAGTMALRNRLQLVPPVPDRYGLFWNKKAVKTRHFEVIFKFSAHQHKDRHRSSDPENGMFAFWLSPDNFTAGYNEQAIVGVRDWGKGLQDQGLTFISNRPNFNGVAAIFSSVDKLGKAKPSASGVVLDGSREMSAKDFPQADSDRKSGLQQTKYLNWLQKEVVVTVNVKLGGEIVGDVQLKESAPSVEIFRLPTDKIANWQEIFMGFSAWSGSPAFIELDMQRVEVRNLDTQSVGEELEASEQKEGALSDLEDPERWKKMLAEEKRYIDQRSQKEAVVRLTKLLSEHVDTYGKMSEKVKSELIWLQQRMDTLDSDISRFVGESKAVNPETGKVETAKIVNHIAGIRSVLSKNSNEQKLEEVHSQAQSLKAKRWFGIDVDGETKIASVAEHAKAVETHVANGWMQLSIMMVILILAVALLGVLFLNRMRYYEKKHYI